MKITLATLIFSFLLSATPSAQITVPSAQKNGRPVDDRVLWAISYTSAFYPELSGGDVFPTIKDDCAFGCSFQFYSFSLILDSRPALPSEVKTSASLPVESHFEFLRDGTFSNWRAKQSEQLRNAIATVDRHTKWTEADIDRLLATQGARYHPGLRSELAASIPVAQLRSCLGDVRVSRVEFFYRNEPDYKDGFPSAELTWVVTLQELQDNLPTNKFVLFIDPFTGKPTFVNSSRR